jgi:kumamolisin
MFPDSVAPVGGGGEHGAVARTALTPEETQASMDFSISLRMRNFDELQARLQAGEKISADEMTARYLPLQSDYDRTAAWLVAEGFALTVADPNHTNLYARGTVAGIANAFGVTFARVATGDGEFTSAITAPSLPADIAPAVLGIDGLQPHVRAHVPKHARPSATSAINSDKGFFTPSDISAYYQVPSTLTGAGQTIAIIIDANVQTSDLTAFWTAAGLPQTIADFTAVPVNGGAVSQSDVGESTLDVEWAGGIATGAKIRLYTISSLINTRISAACTQILSDAKTDSTIRVVSMSFGGTESPFTSLQQTFAQMASAGITVCAASGDGGSNPNPNTGFYGASNPLSVSYPASDPSVTGVGGTTVGLDSNFNGISETSWFQISGGSTSGTGGGFSSLFTRPSWQVGTGLPAGNARCVPDLALVSDGSVSGQQIGALVVQGGVVQGAGGTSLATQVFGGMVALLNQARASAGLSSLGLLGPIIYPLIGSGDFNDITTGNNGAYNATVGYDLCTGIGSTNMTKLVLGSQGVLPPSITSEPQSTTVTVGTGFAFNVTATGGSLTYQWFLNGAAISGATSSTYSKSSAAASDAGSYTVNVSNPVGTATSTVATLTVATIPVITGQPQSTSTTVGGTFSFSVTATGSGTLGYQWNFNGSAISGQTSATYLNGSATAGNAGSYTVVVSNIAGSVTSSAATLTVNAAVASAPAPASSGGGGGGAPSLWFYGALALVAAARLIWRQRRELPAR